MSKIRFSSTDYLRLSPDAFAHAVRCMSPRDKAYHMESSAEFRDRVNGIEAPSDIVTSARPTVESMLAIEDQAEFNRIVDRVLSADELKMFSRSPEFVARLQNDGRQEARSRGRADRRTSIRARAELTAAETFMDEFNAEEKYKSEAPMRAVKAVEASLNKERNDLNREIIDSTKKLLSNGQGLTAELAAHIGIPQNVPCVQSLDVEFSPQNKLDMKKAFKEFQEAHPEVTVEHADTLFALMKAISPSSPLSPLSPLGWDAALKVALFIAELKPVKKPAPVAAPVEKKKVNLEIDRTITPAQKRHDKFNKVVATWNDDGVVKNETEATIDRMSSETYKRFVLVTQGKLERKLSNLLVPVPAYAGRP